MYMQSVFLRCLLYQMCFASEPCPVITNEDAPSIALCVAQAMQKNPQTFKEIEDLQEWGKDAQKQIALLERAPFYSYPLFCYRPLLLSQLPWKQCSFRRKTYDGMPEPYCWREKNWRLVMVEREHEDWLFPQLEIIMDTSSPHAKELISIFHGKSSVGFAFYKKYYFKNQLEGSDIQELQQNKTLSNTYLDARGKKSEFEKPWNWISLQIEQGLILAITGSKRRPYYIRRISKEKSGAVVEGIEIDGRRGLRGGRIAIFPSEPTDFLRIQMLKCNIFSLRFDDQIESQQQTESVPKSDDWYLHAKTRLTLTPSKWEQSGS